MNGTGSSQGWASAQGPAFLCLALALFMTGLPERKIIRCRLIFVLKWNMFPKPFGDSFLGAP
jgi:hypothetical protein